MKPRLSPWVIILGLLLLAEIGSMLGIIPIDPINIFWLVVTVACVWAIMRFLFTKK